MASVHREPNAAAPRPSTLALASGTPRHLIRFTQMRNQMRQECPPGRIFRIRQFLQQQRIGFGLGRRGLQQHIRFLRRLASLFGITTDARADDVLPARLAAAATRHDVIEAELMRREGPAAVLAAMAVAGKEVAAIEAEGTPLRPIVFEQPDDARHLHFEAHALNPIFMRLLVGRAKGAHFAPAREVVIAKLAILEMDDLGTFSIEENEGPANRDNMHGGIETIQHQDARTQDSV